MSRCSLKTIAHNLGIDRQTVHRHLVASGTNYTALLDEVRSELASRYVVEGDRRLAEIGEVLGVTESRISQLHTKAVLRLRSHMSEEELADD